jgi:rfaE bifunctional protein kinase chain/domain
MKADRFHEITLRYSGLRVGIVGDFFLDRYLHINPAKDETSIETGLAVYNVVETRAQPGAAGTILNNLVALGMSEVWPVGFCGDDGEGYELRRALASQAGVRLEHFLTTSARRTPVYCKPLVFNPGQPPRELNRLDSKNWAPTPLDLQRELANRLQAVSSRVDALLLLDQVELPNTGVVTDFVKAALPGAIQANADLVVLADGRRGLRDFPHAILKMNAAELGRTTGNPFRDLETLKREAAQLADRQGQPVFVTLAEDGILGVSPGGRPDHVPAHPVRGPIDIVGAGDAVTANLAAALAARASLREAMELAMAAASVVVHQLGTTGTASIAQLAGLEADEKAAAYRAR